MPKTVKLDDLKPGMTLASDVLDRNGRLLLPSGGALTEKHLRVFKTWGVTVAQIADGAGPAAAEVSDLSFENVEAAEAAATARFKHASLDHPLMQVLFREAVQRSVRKGPPA